MFSIICDSATKTLYIALLKEKEVLEERYYTEAHNHSINIVSGIDEVLKNNNITFKDVDKFICGIGPGSYTGVRMAVTVGKMVSAFTKAKLYQISTLAIMASNFSNKVLSYIDARNGNVFGAIYENGKAILEDRFSTLDDMLNNKYDVIVKNGEYKADPIVILDNAVLVEEPDLLVPNYLRDTEAERNLNETSRRN